MSDTLADLAAWLPSEFLTADDKTNNHLLFPTDFPYEFASSSSTESESDDDDLTGLTRRFTRSVSLQERVKIPYPVEKKRVFSGSPESTLNWAATGTTHVRSSPATPFGQADEDAWDLIYAAAGQVARMKMMMNNVNNEVFANRSFVGAPRPLGPPLSQHQNHQHHHHLNCETWRTENMEFIRQQQIRQRLAGGVNYGGGGVCGGGRPVDFRQTAWPPLPVENQRRQQPSNGFVGKPVLAGSGCGGGRVPTVVKRECAGTGVFLPRKYYNDPPELKKKPACSPAQLPARVAQSLNKSLDPILTQAQPNIHGGITPHYEMLMARRNAAILAHQRRSTTHVGVPEAPIGHPEVVLPQEWTY